MSTGPARIAGSLLAALAMVVLLAGPADAVFTLAQDLKIQADGAVPYQYIRVPTNLGEDKWIQAFEIKAFCKEHLAPYKVPTHYEFRKELPKTTVGKILRRELVRQHKEENK